MYVCVCNAYRESHLAEAIEKAGAGAAPTVEQLYARLGREPRCGRCVSHVQDLIRAKKKPAEIKAS